jgi:hypothetical protein
MGDVMRQKIEYTHNGSIWKSLWLLIRSLLNIAAFGFFWYSLMAANTILVVGSTAILTILVLLNFIFPIVKR